MNKKLLYQVYTHEYTNIQKCGKPNRKQPNADVLKMTPCRDI